MTDLGLLVLRVGCSAMMAIHGWGKVMNFGEYAANFPDPLGVGSPLSLSLAIFGELVCPILIILGVLTRLAAFATFFTMMVAALVIHGGDPFEKRELAVLYALCFLVIVIVGAGRRALYRPSKPYLQ